MKNLKLILILLAVVTITTNFSVCLASDLDQTEELNQPRKDKKKKVAKSTSEPFIAPVSQVSVSPAKQYQILVDRRNSITSEIEAINVSLPQMKKGVAKKALQRIACMQLELASIEKTMSMYPRSISDPNYEKAIEDQQKEAFLQALSLKTDQLIANSNPFDKTISKDPEVEKAYREYIANGGIIAFSGTDFVEGQLSNEISHLVSQNGGRFYTVVFAIAQNSIKSNAMPYDKVFSQKIKNGKIAYFAGAFAQKQDAEKLCNQILAKGIYRDSFVVLIK